MDRKLYSSLPPPLGISDGVGAKAVETGTGIFSFSSMILIVFGFIALLLLAALITGLVLWLRRRKPAVRLLRATKALEEGKVAKARKLLGKIIKSLAYRPQLTEGERGALQEAHLKMAAIFEAEEEGELALPHYQAAFVLGVLPPRFPAVGIKRLAPVLAQTQETEEAALAVYLAFLDLAPSPGEAAGVYQVLESLGTFPEIDLDNPRVTPAEVSRITKVATKVAKADPQRPWPHLSLGLAAMVAGNFEGALPHLVKACQLAPEQAVGYYWLGQACRLKSEPYVKTQNAFKKFLQLSRDEAERPKRAEAAFYLGSSMLEGGSPDWGVVPQPSAEELESLGQAIHWLERALAEGLREGRTYFLLGQAHFQRGAMDKAAMALKSAVLAQPQEREYRFALGMAYLACQRRAEAKQEFLTLLEFSPEEREARWVLVTLYLEDQRWAEAATQAGSLLALVGPDYEILGVLLLALYRQGRYEEVIAKAELFRPYSRQADARPIDYLIARSLALTGRFGEAVEWYALCQELEPTIEVNYYLACAMGHLGRFDEALEALKPVLASETEHQVAAYIQQGHILLHKGQETAARESYRTALALNPENPEALYSLGVTAFREGDLEGALDFFTRCLGRDPERQEARLGEALVREALGEIEAAIPVYERVLELDRDNMAAHERLAVIFARRGDYRRSLEHFLRLEHRATEREETLYLLGFTLLHEVEPALAVQMWSKLLARQPENPNIAVLVARGKYLQGREMVQEGRHAEAAELWEEYLRVFPEDPETRKNLAEIYWRLASATLKGGDSDVRRARRWLQRARELNPGHWKYPYFLALAQLVAGEVQAAGDLLSELVERFPDRPRLRYHLGLVLMLRGESQAALEAWQRAASVDGVDPYGEFATFALANELIGQGEYERAVQLLMPVCVGHSEAGENQP